MGPKVLLIGASGAFGVPLVEEIIKHKSKFGRIGILSSSEKVDRFAATKKQGVEIVVGSLLEAKSYEGFDTVVSLVGNFIMRLQPAMIDLAISAGVRHFYPSEWNSDISQDALVSLRYFRDKHVTRDHLRAKAREVPGFRYTLMITGIFTEWAVSEFYGVDVERHTVNTYGRPEAEINVTSIPDIAKYTVEALLMPFVSDSPEREIRVRGDRLTWKQLIDALGEAQGVEYAHQYLDPKEAREKEIQARRRGDEAAELMWSVKPLAASGNGIAPGRVDNELFSFRPETAGDVFTRVYGGKKG